MTSPSASPLGHVDDVGNRKLPRMRTIGYDFAEQFHRCRRGRHLFQRDFIRKVHQAGARPADRRAVLPALRLSSRPTIWVVHSKMPMVLTMSHIMATSPLTPSIRPRFSAFDGLLTDGQSRTAIFNAASNANLFKNTSSPKFGSASNCSK